MHMNITGARTQASGHCSMTFFSSDRLDIADIALGEGEKVLMFLGSAIATRATGSSLTRMTLRAVSPGMSALAAPYSPGELFQKSRGSFVKLPRYRDTAKSPHRESSPLRSGMRRCWTALYGRRKPAKARDFVFTRYAPQLRGEENGAWQRSSHRFTAIP